MLYVIPVDFFPKVDSMLLQTGIRDKDVMRSIENNLLAPLRRNLEKWMDDPAVSQSMFLCLSRFLVR